VSCGCHHGWVLVDDEYVDKVCPLPPPESPEFEARRLKRAALRNTVKPCAVHNPTAFMRWCAEQAAELVPRGTPPPPDLRRELE